MRCGDHFQRGRVQKKVCGITFRQVSGSRDRREGEASRVIAGQGSKIQGAVYNGVPVDGESVGRARSVEFCEQAPGHGLVIVAVDRNGTDAIAGGDGTRVGEGAVYGDVAVVEGVQGVLGIAAQGRALPYVHIQHLGPPVEGQRAAAYGHPDAVPAEYVAVVAQAEVRIRRVRRRSVARRQTAETQAGEQIVAVGGRLILLHVGVAGVPVRNDVPAQRRPVYDVDVFYPGVAGNVYGGRIPGQGAAYVETLRKRAFQFVEQLVPFIKLGDDVAGLILCGFRPASDV